MENDSSSKNSGISLIELIIVIAIMGVLTGVLSPLLYKYVERSRKARDIYTADNIARAVNIAFIENPDALEAFNAWGTNGNGGLPARVSVSVGGVTESYDVQLVISSGTQNASNKKSNCFNGTVSQFKGPGGKNDGSTGLYGVINRELGLSTTEINSEIIPSYSKKKEGDGPKAGVPYAELDRWRIVKRKDNGMMEIWAAQPNPSGGWPIYRVWPEPDDIYKQ